MISLKIAYLNNLVGAGENNAESKPSQGGHSQCSARGAGGALRRWSWHRPSANVCPSLSARPWVPQLHRWRQMRSFAVVYAVKWRYFTPLVMQRPSPVYCLPSPWFTLRPSPPNSFCRLTILSSKNRLVEHAVAVSQCVCASVAWGSSCKQGAPIRPASSLKLCRTPGRSQQARDAACDRPSRQPNMHDWAHSQWRLHINVAVEQPRLWASQAAFVT